MFYEQINDDDDPPSLINAAASPCKLTCLPQYYIPISKRNKYMKVNGPVDE